MTTSQLGSRKDKENTFSRFIQIRKIRKIGIPKVAEKPGKSEIRKSRGLK